MLYTMCLYSKRAIVTKSGSSKPDDTVVLFAPVDTDEKQTGPD